MSQVQMNILPLLQSAKRLQLKYRKAGPLCAGTSFETGTSRPAKLEFQGCRQTRHAHNSPQVSMHPIIGSSACGPLATVCRRASPRTSAGRRRGARRSRLHRGIVAGRLRQLPCPVSTVRGFPWRIHRPFCYFSSDPLQFQQPSPSWPRAKPSTWPTFSR